jgi:Zn-dependent M28 family amino/carboxypeptidase
VVHKSKGANDNASGVCLLLNFAKALKKYKISIPIEIVFFDKEETGGYGCSYYLDDNEQDIGAVINFDFYIAGGDAIYFCIGRTDRNNIFVFKFCRNIQYVSQRN